MKNKIKFSIASLFLAVILMSFTTEANAPLWVKHGDPFNFAIEFPNTPSRNLLPPGHPSVIHHVKLVQHTAGFPRFELIFKEKNVPFVKTGIVANKMISNYNTAVGGTISKKTVPAGWKGGVQVTAEIIAGKKHIHIRAFILNKCSYLMAVEGQGKFPPMTDVNRFWNSLQPK